MCQSWAVARSQGSEAVGGCWELREHGTAVRAQGSLRVPLWECHQTAIFYLLLGFLSPTPNYLTVKPKYIGLAAKGLSFL